MYDFINDLDEFFCEKYANYDKLCVLPGYKMPLMQASKIDDFGRTRTYTLPANTMRLATQAKKTELLALVKEQAADRTFSFAFTPNRFFKKISLKMSKLAPHKLLKKMLEKYDFKDEEALEQLNVSEEIWKGIKSGKFAPTKNFLFSLALAAHMSYEDADMVMQLCEFEFDYAVIKDVVIAYLLTQRVFNTTMVERALAEYKVSNLFLK